MSNQITVEKGMSEFPYEASNFYLNRYRFAGPGLTKQPQPDLGIVVVIPCFDEPDLIGSLESLKSCELPKGGVEVIVVVNGSENAPFDTRSHNEMTLETGRIWAAENSSDRLSFYLLDFQELPRKHAGVGLARKIGMDEAVRRFEWIGNSRGIIACFDADSLVQENYLKELESHFSHHPKSPGCSIHYEHPLSGPLPDPHYIAILNYELHLRYYVHALRYAGHHHAHQTIGSSMAVRSDVYQKQGGMNRRKAGEDFYFLHKIIPLGNFTECKDTMVIPSPRRSDRVPFGTGRAIGDSIDKGGQEDYPTYAFPIFEDLKSFLGDVPSFFKNESVSLEQYPDSVSTFLRQENFLDRLSEINRQSTRREVFENRFFRWFDGFRVMKFVHHARDQFHPNQEVRAAILELERESGWLRIEEGDGKKAILLAQRLFDRA